MINLEKRPHRALLTAAIGVGASLWRHPHRASPSKSLPGLIITAPPLSQPAATADQSGGASGTARSAQVRRQAGPEPEGGASREIRRVELR